MPTCLASSDFVPCTGEEQPFFGFNKVGVVELLPGLISPEDGYYDHGLHGPGMLLMILTRLA